VTQTKLESDDTTVCDNISDTLIASDNENDTCTSVSEEVDITDNEHGNIFAHHVPYNDDIIVISSDCESDSSVSILKKKK
jgi:formaldehyde-activating enzyme involved in methanogenesis